MTESAAARPSMTQISDKLFIAPQPRLEDFPDLSASGFKGVISNRPADEQVDQPRPAAEQQAAEAGGMSFHFIPVTTATITEADVRSFQKAVAEIAGPVYAHCRSGIRSASLHVIGEVLDGRLAREDLAELSGKWGGRSFSCRQVAGARRGPAAARERLFRAAHLQRSVCHVGSCHRRLRDHRSGAGFRREIRFGRHHQRRCHPALRGGGEAGRSGGFSIRIRMPTTSPPPNTCVRGPARRRRSAPTWSRSSVCGSPSTTGPR